MIPFSRLSVIVTTFVLPTLLLGCQSSLKSAEDSDRNPAAMPPVRSDWNTLRMDEPEKSPAIRDALQRSQELDRRHTLLESCRLTQVRTWEPIEQELLFVRANSMTTREFRQRYPALTSRDLECLADPGPQGEI